MRHQVAGRTLGRKTQHRRAMWRNMAVSLFTHGQITTTIPKAKSLKPFVEKLISAAKKGDLASRRRVISQLGGNRLLVRGEGDESVGRNRYGEITHEARLKAPRVVRHLFEEIAPRYADRHGGYTRIIKLGKFRIGDGTQLCVLQLVGDETPGSGTGSSRRREKADRRMERAAALRKGFSAKAAPQADATGDAAPADEPAEQGADEQAEKSDA